MDAPATERPKVLFVGSGYAGNRNRFLSLKKHTEHDPRIDPSYRSVNGWTDGGLIERLPILPKSLKGRGRALIEASALAKLPRPDVIWTSAATIAGPYLWSQLGPLKRPLVLDIDETLELREGFAPIYYQRPERAGVHRKLLEAQERLLWRSTTLFLVPFEWVSESLQRGGVPADRIRIVSPGIDVDIWRPEPSGKGARSDRLRLVFVGQDFWRKGGDLLMEAMRGPIGARCELEIVTSAQIDDLPPCVRRHDPKPELNSPFIRKLYAEADLFVLPSRAECFGFANLEAFASGLPVMASAVGAVPEFVVPGETGWLVKPTVESVTQGLEQALARREELPEMGRKAREIAVERFDASRNDRAVVDVLLEARERFRAR